MSSKRFGRLVIIEGTGKLYTIKDSVGETDVALLFSIVDKIRKYQMGSSLKKDGKLIWNIDASILQLLTVEELEVSKLIPNCDYIEDIVAYETLSATRKNFGQKVN